MKHIHTYYIGSVNCRQSKIETSTLRPMQKNKTTTFQRQRFIQL